MGVLQKSVGIGRKLVPYILVPHHGEDIVLPPEPVHLLHQVHNLAGGRGGVQAWCLYSTVHIFTVQSQKHPPNPLSSLNMGTFLPTPEPLSAGLGTN